MSAALAHLTWPSAFEAFGPIAFVAVVATLLLEIPILKSALGVRWDDAFGSVFLGHALTLLLFVLVAIPFTPGFREAATSFELGDGSWWAPWWSRLRWIGLTMPALLIPSAREALGWTGSGGLAQTIAVGASVLVQLLVVRSVCDLRWSLRNVATIAGIALVTAGAIVLVLRWPQGEAEEGAVEAPPEG